MISLFCITSAFWKKNDDIRRLSSQFVISNSFDCYINMKKKCVIHQEDVEALGSNVQSTTCSKLQFYYHIWKKNNEILVMKYLARNWLHCPILCWLVFFSKQFDTIYNFSFCSWVIFVDEWPLKCVWRNNASLNHSSTMLIIVRTTTHIFTVVLKNAIKLSR